MKKTTLIAVAVMTVLTAGCGTKTIVVQQESTTIPQAPETTAPHGETEYMQGITEDFPSEVSRLGKANIIELGHLMCQAIDEGVTIVDLVNMADKYNVDAGFIGAIVREAVHNFCPENQWFIDSALNA